MAVTEIRHALEDDLSTERGDKRVHSRTFWVLADARDDSITVRADPRLPREGDPDPLDRGCRVVSARLRHKGKSPLWWAYTYTSTTEYEEDENPLNVPTKWIARTILYEVPTVYDIHRRPIVNKAGDFFEGAKQTKVGWTFTGSKSIPAEVSLDWIDDFVSATNDSSLVIRGKRCPEKTVWLREADIGEPQKTNGVWHSPSRFTLEFNPLGWYFEPLNMGFRQLLEKKEKDPATGQLLTVRRLTEITDDLGRPVSEKQMLDQDGAVPLVDGPNGYKVRKAPLELTDIVTLQFEVKQPMPFARLGIIL